MLKRFIIKLLGKKLKSRTAHISEISRTKLIAVIGVVIIAIENLSEAWGFPIQIPPELYQILAAGGLYTLRDAIKEDKSTYLAF
jgi:hypothetical protein